MGFELFQKIPFEIISYNLAINYKGNILAVSDNNKVKLYEVGENGLYEEKQVLIFLSYVQSVGLSPNSQFLIVGEPGGSGTLLQRKEG